MSTASGWRHNFGALYFDGDDDVDALAALECARISAPGACKPRARRLSQRDCEQCSE